MVNDDSDLVVLCEGQHLRLLRRGRWEFAERRDFKGAVVIVALTPEGRLLLIEQFRPPVGCPVIELPAGLAGDEPGEGNEALAAAAQRELREETGYDAAIWDRLAEGPASAGVSNEVVTFFRASGLTKVGAGGGDHREQIVVHEVLRAELAAWLRQKREAGAVIDVKIFAGLHFLDGGQPV